MLDKQILIHKFCYTGLMRLRVNINVQVNRIVKYFVLSDFFFISGWGFIEPVFAVFVVQKIPGANLATVGIAVAIYWILRSVLQIPLANILDQRNAERDSFRVLVLGLFLAALAAFAYTLVAQIWQLYALQVLHAVALSCYTVSWPAIFSRHLDKSRISFDWSFDNTIVGIASGVSGLLAGLIGLAWGFNVLFVLAGLLSLVGAFVILGLPEITLPRPTTPEERRDHTPANIGM
jgi:MFS family permease